MKAACSGVDPSGSGRSGMSRRRLHGVVIAGGRRRRPRTVLFQIWEFEEFRKWGTSQEGRRNLWDAAPERVVEVRGFCVSDAALDTKND